MGKQKICLRPVTLGDGKLLFEWYNDDEGMINCFCRGEISFDEFVCFLDELLGNSNCMLFILEEHGEPRGGISLNYSDNNCHIYYTIMPVWRGQGYERVMLQLAEIEVINRLSGMLLIAKVGKSNVAEQKLFQQLDYKEQEYKDFYLYEKNASMTTCDTYMSLGAEVLLLSNNKNSFVLYDWLKDKCNVQLYSGRLNEDMLKNMHPSMITSYNYRYIIPQSIINLVTDNIINLHISYLPWNKGADPNIWSFIDDTPKGVTIHKLTAELDDGAIIYQRELYFDEEIETLATSYVRLNDEIVKLFKENWENLYCERYSLTPQKGVGSIHKACDLAKFLNGDDIDYHLPIRTWKKIFMTEGEKYERSV